MVGLTEVGKTPGQAIPSSEGAPFFTFLNTASLRVRQSPTPVAKEGGGCGELRLLPSSAGSLEQPLASDHSEGDYNLVSCEVGPQLEIRKTSTSSDNSNADSAYRLGASFPFVSFSSSGPSTPVPSPQMPSFSDAITVDKSETQTRFRDLGRWISFHGGRQTFVRWLADLLYNEYGSEWKNVSEDEVTSFLLDQSSFGVQFDEVIHHESDLFELLQLINMARQIQNVKRTLKRKRVPVKRTFNKSAISMSRCQKRNEAKRLHRCSAFKKRQKHKRRLAISRASVLNTTKKGCIRVGSWNTRGMGAPYGKDYSGKIQAITKLIAERK